MRIISNEAVVDINNDDIIYDCTVVNAWNVDLLSLSERITQFLKLDENCQVFIDKRPGNYSLGVTFILLVIGMKKRCVFSLGDGKDYEITFSHNFPIVREPNLFKLFLDNLPKLSDSQLIVLGERGDFLVVDVANDLQYQEFWKRKGQFVKRIDKLFTHKKADCPLPLVLDSWRRYCIEKFNVEYSLNRLEAYSIIYSTPGFLTDVYSIEDSTVSQGVVFISDYSKTMYYCIFSWNNLYAKYSPGIYAYCKSIQWCHENGYYFSFCYGKQKYKYDLIENFTIIEE